MPPTVGIFLTLIPARGTFRSLDPVILAAPRAPSSHSCVVTGRPQFRARLTASTVSSPLPSLLLLDTGFPVETGRRRKKKRTVPGKPSFLWTGDRGCPPSARACRRGAGGRAEPVSTAPAFL